MQLSSVSNATSGLEFNNSTITSKSSGSFTNIFEDALKEAINTQKADEQGTLALLAGENSGIHTTMVQSEKAELALNFAIQIRNKVIDAYNEIMRMQL